MRKLNIIFRGRAFKKYITRDRIIKFNESNEDFEEELEKFELPLSPSRENNNLKNIHLNTEMNRGMF